MAMRVLNNNSAMLALGELKKNDNSLQKQLQKVSSGMKIVGAGDGASEYSISEKMRIRVRALGQNHDNVSKGADMLQTAADGIENQTAILRTIKQKVIDAANDSNSDADRATIQKEINQGYDQMQDIAATTMYGERRVLLEAANIDEVVRSWEVKNEAVEVPDSEMTGLLEMNQVRSTLADTLDGQQGPFDIFHEWSEKNTGTVDALGLTTASTALTGATTGDPNTITIDLSGQYSSVSQLNNVGFSVPANWGGYYTYVLTQDPSGSRYRSSPNEVDISGCGSVADVAARMASAINSQGGARSYVTAKADGTKIELTTRSTGTSTNSTTAAGAALTGGTDTIPKTEHRDPSPAVSPTGVIGSPINWDVTGLNEQGEKGIPDSPHSDGRNAQKTWDLSSVASGTGIVLQCGGSNNIYIQFDDSSTGWPGTTSTNIHTIGKNATTSFTMYGYYGGVTISLAGGKMTVTTNNASYGASQANSFSLGDGFPEGAAQSEIKEQPEYDITYTEVAPLSEYSITNHQTGTDGSPATYDMDLSGYQTTDPTALETLISDLVGKGLILSDSYYNGVQFVDSSDVQDGVPGNDSLYKLNNNSAVNRYYSTHVFQTVDLNDLRTAVQGGTSIADAFVSLVRGKLRTQVVPDGAAVGSGTITGLRFTGSNSTKLDIYEGGLRHYDLDFKTFLTNNPNLKLPDDLDNKGFRTYCATDSNQWFNFLFVNGTESLDDKPLSGTRAQDIKSIVIDISNVTDASSLVEAIYDQAEPVLEGSNARFNHLMRLAGDPANGVLTIYDNRRFPVTNTTLYPDRQEEGAKIGTGLMDNVILSKRNVYSDHLVIQDTDHASQNIRIKIPRTTLDHVFGYIPGSRDQSEFNVYTRESREMMLGVDPEKGALDKALDYLLDASTFIGAQINRMRTSGSNITTQNEATQGSESTIRDADMAKEMTGLVRSNVLAQSAQAMLAQANQNSGTIMQLLQG